MDKSPKTGGAPYRIPLLIFLNLFLFVCLVSCELFLSPSHTRENPDDEKAQIASVQARQIDDSDTYTVELSFMWRDPSDWTDENEYIDEVRVDYNIGSPPPSKVTTLFQKKSREFERETGTSLYTWTLDQFSPGDEVWFALYPKTESGWKAPLYEKIEVQESLGSTLTKTFITTKDTFLFDRAAGDVTSNPATPSVANPAGEYNEQFVVAGYDLPDNTWCESATLELYDEVTLGETGYVVPLVSSSYGHSGPEETWYTLDFENKIEFTFSNGTQIIDITKAVNAAMLYKSDAVAIVASEGVTGANISLGSLNISYYSTNNDWNEMLAYYTFTGNPDDFWGTYTGTVTGAVLTDDRYGKTESAYSYNGTDAFIDTGLTSNTAFEGDFTVSVWVRPDVSGTQHTLLSKDGDTIYGQPSTSEYQLEIRGDSDNFRFIAGSTTTDSWDSVTSSESIVPGQWYHVVTVMSGTEMSLYVDGGAASTSSYAYTRLTGTNNPLEIGRTVDSQGDPGNPVFFEGAVDDLRVYESALTEEEIQTIYDEEKP